MLDSKPKFFQKRRYNWLKYANNRWYTFKAGRDFKEDMNARTVIVAVYNWAKRNNFSLEYRQHGKTEFQFRLKRQ